MTAAVFCYSIAEVIVPDGVTLPVDVMLTVSPDNLPLMAAEAPLNVPVNSGCWEMPVATVFF